MDCCFLISRTGMNSNTEVKRLIETETSLTERTLQGLGNGRLRIN